jgi:hypothetical protein
VDLERLQYRGFKPRQEAQFHVSVVGGVAQILGDFVRQLRNHFRDDSRKPEP